MIDTFLDEPYSYLYILRNKSKNSKTHKSHLPVNIIMFVQTEIYSSGLLLSKVIRFINRVKLSLGQTNWSLLSMSEFQLSFFKLFNILEFQDPAEEEKTLNHYY